MDNFIQWNCRGLKANLDELQLLMSEQKVSIFCLQETFLKPSDNLSLRKYHMYNTYGPIVQNRAIGGSTILVRNGVIHSRINLTTPLQAVAVRVTQQKTITICSIYLPPSRQTSLQELNNLYNQLPSPSIILGDFNGHSPLWGSTDTNNRGEVIEDFINTNNLCVFNDGSMTFFHSSGNSYSSIDLSVCDPNLFLDYEWKVLDDTHGSDHFPILLKPLQPGQTSYAPRWKFSKAHWNNFTEQCVEKLILTKYDNSASPADLFTIDLIDIANSVISKSKSNPNHTPKPWFDTEVKQAIKARKKALSLKQGQQQKT